MPFELIGEDVTLGLFRAFTLRPPCYGYVRFISMLGLSWVSFSFSPA